MKPYYCPKRGKYKATIRLGSIGQVTLGWYHSSEEAQMAYKSAVAEFDEKGEISKRQGERYIPR